MYHSSFLGSHSRKRRTDFGLADNPQGLRPSQRHSREQSTGSGWTYDATERKALIFLLTKTDPSQKSRWPARGEEICRHFQAFANADQHHAAGGQARDWSSAKAKLWGASTGGSGWLTLETSGIEILSPSQGELFRAKHSLSGKFGQWVRWSDDWEDLCLNAWAEIDSRSWVPVTVFRVFMMSHSRGHFSYSLTSFVESHHVYGDDYASNL